MYCYDTGGANAQGVVNLTLLSVVAISKIGALLLKGAVTPVVAWVLEDISEDALDRVNAAQYARVREVLLVPVGHRAHHQLGGSIDERFVALHAEIQLG